MVPTATSSGLRRIHGARRTTTTTARHFGLEYRRGREADTIYQISKNIFRETPPYAQYIHTEILATNAIPSIVSEWKTKGYRYGYHHLMAAFLAHASKTITAPAQLNGSYSPVVNSGLDIATLGLLGTFLAARAELAWRLCPRTPSVAGVLFSESRSRRKEES